MQLARLKCADAPSNKNGAAYKDLAAGRLYAVAAIGLRCDAIHSLMKMQLGFEGRHLVQ